jgi:hypothetical protein
MIDAELSVRCCVNPALTHKLEDLSECPNCGLLFCLHDSCPCPSDESVGA